MSDAFNSYPVLENRHIAELGYVSDIPKFYYSENFEEFPLELDISSENAGFFSGSLSDPRCSWYPETHDLILSKSCRVTSPYCLFGAGGIAASNAKIGIALMWISSQSDERGVIPFGEISRTDMASSYSAEYRFNKGNLKGSLKLQTILYLKESRNTIASESYFAKNPGTILGVLDQAEIFVDGNGSLFPIAVIDAPGEPLWHVYFDDSVDAMQDRFTSENVEIRLNKAHPFFDSLKIETSMTESPLFLEVISSALFVIVEAVKDALGEDWDNMLAGEEFESGSIAEAVNYFITKLQWDVSSPSALSVSIKEFFEKSKQG